MNRLNSFMCLVAFCSASAGWYAPAYGETIWVDQSAAAPGDGAEASPFTSIEAALRKVEPGSVVMVREGVYREAVVVRVGGTAEAPFVLRAAEGERVVISGFEGVDGWAQHQGDVYTTTVDGAVRDLYVSYVPQQVAVADAGKNSPWSAVDSVDIEAGVVTLGEALKQITHIDAVAADVSGLMSFHYISRSHRPYTYKVTAMDLDAGSVAVAGTTTRYMSDNDLMVLVNHPALIDRPGEWAARPIADGKTQLYFWPGDVEDLKETQVRRHTRAMLSIGRHDGRLEHIKIQGIEITGSQLDGVSVTDSEGVQISGCIVHNNGRNGIQTRRSSHARISNNVVFGNGGNGISVSSTPDALIQENEVCFNYADGIVVAGDVSRKGNEPTSDRAIIRRNYVHHHQILEHPDNFQTYFGTNDLIMEDNLALFAGQGLMTQDMDGARFSGNVFFGAGATLLIFGHRTSNDWDITNNTLGLGGWGTFQMDGEKYNISRNVLFNTRIHGASAHEGDHNLYWDTDSSQPVLRGPKPGMKPYASLSEFAAETGQQSNSKQADPAFANAPVFQATAEHFEKCSTDFLFVRQAHAKPTANFAVGDTLEINGDGVARLVTEVTDEGVGFAPALPQPVFREAIVWNWGANHDDFTLNFSLGDGSPALTMGPDGQAVGATLDIKAYAAGDFDADGKRDLPAMAQDILDAIPDPNAPAIPPLLP